MTVESIHLTSATGTQCQSDLESEWVVLDEPGTACYRVGGAAGFLGYPKSFEYDRGLLSSDGIGWSEIVAPAIEPYPTLAVLKDRIMAMSVLDVASDQPSQIRIWLGTIR